LTPEQALILSANRDAVLAEETLRERGGELTPESLYRLTLLATGDRDRAEMAQARRVLEIERHRHGSET